MGEILDQRRLDTTRRTKELKVRLSEAEALCAGKACVYMTGSFARGEAHEWSDLDLFIVGQGLRVALSAWHPYSKENSES